VSEYPHNFKAFFSVSKPMSLLILRRIIELLGNEDEFSSTMFENFEETHELWELVSTFLSNAQMAQKALESLFIEDIPNLEGELLESAVDKAYNSLLFAKAVFNILNTGGAFEVDRNFKSWESFFKSVKGTEWSVEDWKQAIACFLREKRPLPESPFTTLIRCSPVFIILEQLRENNVSTFDSIEQLEEEISQAKEVALTKKRKFEKILSEDDNFLALV